MKICLRRLLPVAIISALSLAQTSYAQVVDTDGDGLLDNVETGTGTYVSLSNTGTNPNVADSDGDGLTDKQEIDGVNSFKSNPFVIDTDGDLISDASEVNATPPTDPNDPSKYPSGSGSSPLTSLHAIPVQLGNPQQISIDESFAPFGHRPERDKIGDDGSSTIIDSTGVLIWTNRNGEAVTITNAAFSKTLHVSNTECLVYKNRLADGWNSATHQAEIVIHRRGATGGIISSTPFTIDGTVLDTTTLTATTYGYMLVSGKRVDDGNESTRVTQVTLPGNPTVVAEEVNKVDVWDGLDLTLNIITWDGARRTLAGGRYSIPKSDGTNFTDGVTLGHGSDGSMLLNMTTAGTFLDRYDDTDPGDFASKTSSIWVSATINKESIRELPTAIDTLAYVDNDRLIGQRDKFGSLTEKEIVDYRQFSVGVASEVSTLALAAGETVLPFAPQSLRGFSPYIYTLDAAGTSLKLYRADATITALGTAVTLPAAIKITATFVRNPRDGSLLVKTDSALVWVPTTTDGITPAVTGLGNPKAIPNSAIAKPLFVTSKECVVWLNGDEPPINGKLPPADIAHFQIDGSILRKANLTPPIEGSYVVLSSVLSPDPDLEGWYVSTFEKDTPASTLLRTYQLLLSSGVDRDNDGITDYDEITGRFNNGVATSHFDPDTDGDGLSDGRELLPFDMVSGSLTWEEARLAAIAAGGRLAVLDGQDQQDRFAAWLAANKPSGAYWVGGHDTIQEGSFRWVDAVGGKSGSSVSNPKNWAVGQPSDLNNADGMQVASKANYKWSMAPVSTKQSYIIEFSRSNPIESNLDSDGDGITDDDEINKYGTNPFLVDTDFDGLSDFEELFPAAGISATNPLNADSDNDGYSDFSELRATPATNPNNGLSIPLGYAPSGTSNRIQQGFSPSEISVSATWTPVLQRTDQTKWGDDGSAVYADASGLLFWRSNDGVMRAIPNSSKAIPLLVSNQKVIVWHNAFNNLLDTPPGNGAGIDPLEIYLYKATANGGAALDKIISDGANKKISGTNVNATAPITTTSQAYHLVTKDVDQTYLYRLTFTGDVQAVTTIPVRDDREFHRAFGHGSDGSFVGGLVTGATYWIRGTVPAIASGVWEPLQGRGGPGPEPRRMFYTSNTRAIYEEQLDVSEGRNIYSASRLDDVVTITVFDHGLSVGDTVNITDVNDSVVITQTSTTIITTSTPSIINGNYVVSKIVNKNQFQYSIGIQEDQRRQSYDVRNAKLIVPDFKSYKLIESRRNQFTGFGADFEISTGDRDITPVDSDYYRVLQISTQTIEGDTRWIYALTKAQNELIVYRLTNVAFIPVYRAKLPEGTLLDEYATVEKINPADGSAVITSENIDNVIWIHPTSLGLKADSTKNALLIPDSRLAKGMFVSGSQLVTWHNAYDGTDGPSVNGMLNKALVRHYRQNNGSFVKQPGGADYTDLSSSIQGTFVLATPIFSPSANDWNFWTIDKPTQTSTKALMRNYRLSDNANADSDGDGMPDVIENKNGTNPSLYDTDGDGLSDGDELTYATNSLLADTDGDGVNDFQEAKVLFTDPKDAASFASSPSGSSVSFAEGRGNYEGLLYHSNDGYGFKLALNVTPKGAFSGSLKGNFGKASVRGMFAADGSWSGRVTNPNTGVLSMRIAKQPGGYYAVQGSLATPTGGTYYFHARRTIGFPARKLTFEASRIGNDAGPTGSAIATGIIGKGGKITQQIYNPDGSRATYAGSVLEGNFMALYARTKGGVPTVMLGNVILQSNPAGKSDFDGIVRLFNRNYDQERSLSGAYYSPSTMGTLPLSAILRTTANNAIFSWSDGRFDGVNKVASWLPNKVTVPTSQNDKTTAKFDRKTGLLTVDHTRTDAMRGLANSKSKAFAVVVQGKDKLSGFYTGAGSSGGFSVQENIEGLQPEFTYISPLNKTVSADSVVYEVNISATGDWTIDVPSGSWITASQTSGTGNATVEITVEANATNARRETSIKIAGYTHKIEQSYR